MLKISDICNIWVAKIPILTFLEASEPAVLIQMFINCFTVQMLCSCSPEDKC